MADGSAEPSVDGIVSALEDRHLHVEDGVRAMLAGVVDDAGGQARLEGDGDAMANLGVLLDEVSRTAREVDTEVVDVEVMRRTFLRICPLPPWCR
jgi:hypothetical protein